MPKSARTGLLSCMSYRVLGVCDLIPSCDIKQVSTTLEEVLKIFQEIQWKWAACIAARLEYDVGRNER